MEILRERHRILAQDGDYHILVAVDDRANEIGDAYVERLMHWIQSVWDWEAVAPGRDRVEEIRAAVWLLLNDHDDDLPENLAGLAYEVVE